MTPLHAWLERRLPRPLATVVLGIIYAVLVIAVLLCMTRPSQEFIYL
jgi:predicted PurR-regulated permease PerM